MDIKVTEKNDIAVVNLAGEIELYNSKALKATVDDLMSQGRNRVLFELAEVSYIDSSGIGIFMDANTRLKEASGALKLANLSGKVLRIFQLTKLTRTFAIYSSEQEALASFGA